MTLLPCNMNKKLPTNYNRIEDVRRTIARKYRRRTVRFTDEYIEEVLTKYRSHDWKRENALRDEIAEILSLRPLDRLRPKEIRRMIAIIDELYELLQVAEDQEEMRQKIKQSCISGRLFIFEIKTSMFGMEHVWAVAQSKRDAHDQFKRTHFVRQFSLARCIASGRLMRTLDLPRCHHCGLLLYKYVTVDGNIYCSRFDAWMRKTLSQPRTSIALR